MGNLEEDNYLKKELYELIKTDESIFDFIQESSLDGLWYWDLENPENEWMNPTFWKVLGYNPEEMPHKASAWRNIINQNDLQTAIENFTKHCENPNHPYDQIVRYTHKNGSMVWIRCRGMAIRDINGKPTRMLGAHHDITASKASMELNQTLAEMLDIAPNSITVHDMDGNFLYANQKTYEIHGYLPSVFLNLNLHKLDVPSSEALIAERIELIEKNGYASFEVEHFRKDGSTFPLEVYAKKVIWQGKAVLLSIATDITERKVAESELINAKEKAEESDRLKTAFLQNMSHEIRTPMNAIMGFSSLLSENFNNKEKLENFSKIIDLRCNDLLDIVNDVLDISKIESGQNIINLEIFSLNELFNELVLFFKDYKERINKQDIKICFHLAPEGSLLIVKTDKLKLKQIIINLVSNALKFTTTGSISCGYTQVDGKLQFYVSDTGIGIPVDKFDYIFERFSQLKHPTIQNIGGTGLGLPIVKGLVKLLGGNVWLESECDKGTTFYFTIDYLSADAICDTPLGTENKQEVNSNSAILIVEDDFYNAEYLKEVLSNVTSNIITVSNGLSAVKIVQEQKIDLILMDIRLPDISGYEATQLILRDNPKIKIIAQTAYAANTEHQKAIEAGCVDYISKPTKQVQLLKMMKKYLK